MTKKLNVLIVWILIAKCAPIFQFVSNVSQAFFNNLTNVSTVFQIAKYALITQYVIHVLIIITLIKQKQYARNVLFYVLCVCLTQHTYYLNAHNAKQGFINLTMTVQKHAESIVVMNIQQH